MNLRKKLFKWDNPHYRYCIIQKLFWGELVIPHLCTYSYFEIEKVMENTGYGDYYIINNTDLVQLYLDDMRPAPFGWVRVFDTTELMWAYQNLYVTHISLDNDLGEGEPEGFTFLDWLEEHKATCGFPLAIPELYVHSENAVRGKYMRDLIERIRIK